MTQPTINPTLYILTLLKEHDSIYNLYLLDGTQFENETERFDTMQFLIDNGFISKVQGGIGQTYRLTDKGDKHIYQIYFHTVIQYLADHSDNFNQVSEILKELSIPHHNDEIANAIYAKLKNDDLVFATEESGVMINENGRQFLSEHKFGLTRKSNDLGIVNTGVLIQGSQINQSPFSNHDHSRQIETSKEGQIRPEDDILPNKKRKIFNWITNNLGKIIIGVIAAVVARYVLIRLGWI